MPSPLWSTISTLFRVDTALALEDDVPIKAGLVRELLVQQPLFTVGHKVSEDQADMLTIKVKDPDEELIPVFTSLDFLEQARLRRPEWQTMDVLEMPGKELLEDDAGVVINPLTKLQYRLPRVTQIQPA